MDPNNPSIPTPISTGTPPETYTIKVDGADKVVTKDELVQLAQKGVASDSRFQEAARMKREAEKALTLQRGLKALNEGWDEDVFRSVAEGLDMAPDAIEATIRSMQQEQNPAPAAPVARPAPPAGTIGANPAPQPRAINFDLLDPELKEVILGVVSENWDRDVQNSLAKDPVIGYNTKKPGQQEVLLRQAKGIVRRRILEDASAGRDRTRLLGDMISELRTLVQDFGTLAQPTPPSGLGPAPSAGRSEVYPTQKPKRVDVTDSGYSDNIADTIGFKLAKALRG